MDSQTVTAENMSRRKTRQRPRRPRAKERMDAERLPGRREVAGGPKCISDDEHVATGLPEGHLPPHGAPGEPDEAERPVGRLAGHAETRNPETAGDGSAVALVPIEELHYGLRVPERADLLVEARCVDGIEKEDPPLDLERMRRALQEAGLRPAEAALELVAELERQPPMNV
jgi:hypothetical protein